LAAELSFDGRGLPREDELLARVIVDLGLARQGDVLNAVETVRRSRAEGQGRTLAQTLQDTGSLHPRFVTVVMKAVNNKLVAEGLPPAELPKPPKPKEPAPAAPAPEIPAPPPAAAAPPVRPAPAASAPQAPPPEQAPQPQPNSGLFAEPGEELPREGPDVAMPKGIFFKEAPKGEGFSRRSKSEVAAAWAAKKKGGKPAEGAPSGKKEFTAEDRLARIGGPLPPPPSPTEETLPGAGNPLAALVGPKGSRKGKPRPPGGPLAGTVGPAKEGPPPGPGPGDSGPAPRGPIDPRVGLSRPPEEKPAPRQRDEKKPAKPLVNPLSALISPKQRRGQPKGPPKKRYKKKRRKFAASGATQSINVDDLRAELGIESKASGPEAAETISDEKRKSIELQAFVRRAVRSMLHQQCLDVVLKKRLTTLTPSRLAEESACRERDAKRVLDDWKSAGIMLLEPDAMDSEYKFAPAKADLATVREFMVAWNDAEWHNKLLGWIIEEEHK